MQECVSYFKEELTTEKDKVASLELDLSKRQNKIKDLQSDKVELEKKISFYTERIESLDKELHRATTEMK